MFGFLAKLFRRTPAPQPAPQPAEPVQNTVLPEDDGLQMDDGDLGDNVSFEDDSPLTAEQLNAVSRQADKH